ncbi:ceramidase domain-containing protein [Rhodobacter calidifons]|uniref:Ceramidase n=1 Tax=Rhodobacter calidifons TaxID=2715277 RepID=A0ABX0GBN1_9RHOB|nr:ceramidase domain-containing protein [Rhodobacter calidifons]NHB78268.1 ceramidase [Rhodobacter calidifons]
MFQPIDAYCERTSAAYWAEPVNALTNAAFLIAAFVMWRRTHGLPMARAMCVVLAVIGVGSYLFHTHANGLTAALDVGPILIFILVYIFAATRDLMAFGPWWAAAAVVAFFPYAALMVPVLSSLMPFLGSSAGYAPIPVLILAYAAGLRRRAPATARGMALGAAILVVSLTFRTLDGPLCEALPLGTHFLWHLLNGLMLGWMIEVYRRHMLAKALPPG